MRPILIASLGNPGSEYAHTLHSAGHTLLRALVLYTHSSPLSISRNLTGTKAPCSYSSAGYAFWESPNHMNTSGPDLHTAWRKFCGGGGMGRGGASKLGEGQAMGGRGVEVLGESMDESPWLIVLHDELELPIGRFSVKHSAGLSARGHNGLKSLLATPNMRTTPFTRIGVGIGPRPVSREPEVVAKFVLRKMTREERGMVEGLVGEVWEEVERVRDGRSPGAFKVGKGGRG